MLKTRKTPRDRAFFPTEFPRVSRVPEGISPEAFHLNRELDKKIYKKWEKMSHKTKTKSACRSC